jgi:nucleotide-binding universal stress UspA family protein
MERILDMWVGVELQPRSQEVSQGSRGAFNQAMALACQVGARITIMHSTWHEGRTVPIGDAGKAALDAMVTEAIGAGLRTRLEVTDQRPWLALLRAALNESADLILVGKRDQLQAPSGRRLGSVATKLVRKCPAPVWVVKPGHDLEYKLILVATDLTGVGDQALRWSASLARWRGAALHIVHAWRHDSDAQERYQEDDPEAWQEELSTLREETRVAVLERCGNLDLPAPPTVHLSRKSPARAIKETVGHLVPDLLVLGSLSRAGRAGIFVGETAERLMGRLGCSLLVLKPDGFECPVAAD